MRKFGSVPNEAMAQRLIDYLLTQRILATTNASHSAGEGWELWVREEDQLPEAQRILAEYRSHPDDPRFEATRQAAQIRKLLDAEIQRRSKLQRSMPQGGMMGLQGRSTPITITIIVLAVIASLVTKFGAVSVERRETINAQGEPEFEFKNNFGSLMFRNLMLVDPWEYMPDRNRPQLGNKDPLSGVKRGELWRLITPVLLHGSIMHLAFNMLALYSLGGVIERLHGHWKLLLLVVVTGVIASLAQAFAPPSLGGTPIALGASGAIFGLFGYLWVRPMFDPRYPIRIPQSSVVMILGWLVICMTPLIPNIANAAHVGGLIAGIALVPLAMRLWPSS